MRRDFNIKRFGRHLIFAFLSLLLLTSYTNCSGFTAQSVGAPSFSSLSLTGTNGSELFAYQDRIFKFEFSSMAQGSSYSFKGTSPAWLTLDPSTGVLSGLPTSYGYSEPFLIEVTEGGEALKVYGPYSLRILGNPLKNQQWHLENTGQKSFAYLAGTAGNDIHLKNTIAAGITGTGVRIAVSDSGVHQSHPGLRPNILTSVSRNYLNDFRSTNTWLGDSTPPAGSSNGNAGHGTAVGGIIAERGWTDSGGRGVAPLASIAGFLFIQAQSVLTTRGLSTAALLDQFQGDFDIFNYSWGISQCSFAQEEIGMSEKLRFGVDNLRGQKGAIYVKAAGNEFVGDLKNCSGDENDQGFFLGNSNFIEENTSPYTIITAALSARGTAATYSSPGSNIWISAPGGEGGSDAQEDDSTSEPAIITTDSPNCGKGIKASKVNQFDRGSSPNSACLHTSAMNGTSSAAPIVTGAIALILEANPNLTWREVKHVLAATADQVHPGATLSSHPVNSANLAGHLYEKPWITNAAGFRFHNWYGFGRINVDAAVTMAKSLNLGWGPLRETNSGGGYSSGYVNLSIPDATPAGVSHSIQVSDAMTIEAVQVSLDLMNCVGEQGVELTSPSGTQSILMNINSMIRDSATSGQRLLSNAFYGENSAGTWTLRVIDGKAGCQSQLASWKINVLGH